MTIRWNLARRALAAVALLASLSGCERSVFQNPPAAAEACDPDLVGRWISQGDTRAEDGEFEATIDAQCRLVTQERRDQGVRRSEPTSLQNARVGGVRYLWLDAGWAHRSFAIEPTLIDRDGDVYLFAYRIERDRLRLDAPPHRALAQRVVAGDIEGDVLQHSEELTVRLEGDSTAIRRLLAKHRLYRFDDDALIFRRASEGDAQ